MTRILHLCLCTLAVAACGDTTGTTDVSVGGTAADTDNNLTTDDPSTDSPTLDDPTTQATTDDPTSAGTIGGSSDGTGTTGATATGSATTGDPNEACGDGVKTGEEQCDDGNQTPGDGCEPGCVATAVCGNNTVEDPEQCDDGNQTPGDGCEADCALSPPQCGNGKQDDGEGCDDGNQVDGGADDFCNNDCSVFVPPSCKVPIDYVVCDADLKLTDKADKTQAHKAMGICNDLPENSVQITDFDLQSQVASAWQVARGFGSYAFDHDMNPNTPNKLLYRPREGETFLMISTGEINTPNADGIVIEQPNSQNGNGDNGNADDDVLPPPFQTKAGSNDGAGGTPFQHCDGIHDCSDTLQAQWELGQADPQDQLWFTFKATVPEGNFGYSFDFVFCSAEWPIYVDTGFNDLLIAYQQDPSADDPNAMPPVDPYTGNITFIPDPNDDKKGLPLTITALDPYFQGPGYTGFEPQLKGTGFENAACTDWFTAKGGVRPGAEVTIGFYIADMTDNFLATLAILDNFRWSCEGCVPNEVDDCGVQAPQ